MAFYASAIKVAVTFKQRYYRKVLFSLISKAALKWDYNCLQLKDFKSDRAGKILRVPRPPVDYWAFYPNSLPPVINLSENLVMALSAADRALSELAGVARTLPNLHLLIGLFVRREAVLSSRIEGTQASLSDLLFFVASQEQDARTPDVREVRNYVQAMEYGLKRLQSIPVSLRLIRELHEKLMSGVRGQEKTPGEFRRSQNWIGPSGCTLLEAKYVPPPDEDLLKFLNDFEKYLHTTPELPPLLRLSFIHYQFEAIHPFLDGNGRVGRLLITLLLCDWKILSQPLLYLSAYFEKNRDEYYAGLLAVSQQGEWEAWARYFLAGVEQQSRDALQRVHLLQELSRSYRIRIDERKESSTAIRLAELLFDSPVITISAVAEKLGVSFPTASTHVNRFVSMGILRKSTSRQWNRIYEAPQIMHIVTAETAEELEATGQPTVPHGNHP